MSYLSSLLVTQIGAANLPAHLGACAGLGHCRTLVRQSVGQNREQSEAFKRRRTGWVTRLQGLQAGIPQEHETRGGTLARVPTVDRRRTAVYLRTTDASRCAIINLPANSAEILATLARLQVPIETECRGE